MKIITDCDSMNRWQAYVAGTLDGGETNVVGSGTSESEAIEDLLEKRLEKRLNPGKHVCCWERENPDRCILCCQCGKKFAPNFADGMARTQALLDRFLAALAVHLEKKGHTEQFEADREYRASR